MEDIQLETKVSGTRRATIFKGVNRLFFAVIKEFFETRKTPTFDTKERLERYLYMYENM